MLKRLVATTVFVSMSRGLTTGANLAVMFFVSRFLGAASLGVYGICFALMYLVYTATSFNLEAYLGREAAVAVGDGRRLRGLQRTVWSALSVGVLLALAVWGVAGMVYAHVPLLLLGLAAVCGLLLGLDMNLGGFLLGMERAEVETVTNLAATIILLVPLGLWPRSIDINGVFWLRAAGLTAGILAKAFVLRRLIGVGPVPPRRRWFPGVRYFWFDHMAGYFLRQADILLLALFVDLQQLGVYFLALRIYLAVGILAEVAARAVIPYLSRAYHRMEPLSLGILLRRLLFLALGCGAILALGLILASGWILSLFRPALETGGVWLRWLALAVPLRMGRFIMGAFLSASRYQKQRFFIHLIDASTLVLLTLVLGLLWLAPGVLAARLASEAWGFVLFLAVAFFRLPESRALRGGAVAGVPPLTGRGEAS